MIETAIPDINVEELMQRVRVEAAKLRSAGGRAAHGSVRPRSTTLPPIRVLPPPPRLPVFKSVDPKQQRLASMLREAREKSEGDRRIPRIFRRFFRKQGGYNRLLIDSAAALGKSVAQLAKRLGELAAAVEGQSRWQRAVAEYRQGDTAWMRATAQQIGALQDEVAELRAKLEALRSQTGGNHGGLSAAERDDDTERG